jgi:hypothetical protein
MDGNVFTSTFSSVATTTADLFQITAPANSRVEICDYEVCNLSSAPVGSIQLQLIRGSTTAGSGGSSGVAMVRTQPWGATAGSSVVTGNTTLASTGTGSEVLHVSALTVAEPVYLSRPWDGADSRRSQSEKFYLEASQRCVLRASSTASASLSGTLRFREIGLQ